jgi:hypothetical protein
MGIMEVSWAEQTKARGWQLTEFVMRTWSEPALADRYRADPVATLAAAGIRIHGPQEPPELRAGSADGIVIEDLDHAAPVSARFTYCG